MAMDSTRRELFKLFGVGTVIIPAAVGSAPAGRLIKVPQAEIPQPVNLAVALKVAHGPSPYVFYTIAGAKNIDISGPSVDEIEQTIHSTSPHRTFKTMLIDIGSIAFECSNVDLSHYALAFLYQNRVTRAFQILTTLSNGTQQTRRFQGFVEYLSESCIVDGLNIRNVVIRITSAPNRTILGIL